MADLQHMSRVLYHHDWTDLEDWVRNVDQLADLSDDEIAQLECCTQMNVVAATRCCARDPAPVRRSLVERTRHGITTLCDSLRFSRRRPC
jgi:hypothetical protein